MFNARRFFRLFKLESRRGVSYDTHRVLAAWIVLGGCMLLFGSLGMPELLIILVVVILLFGASRLPQIGKGLGEGIRNFKKSFRDGEKEQDPQDDPVPDKKKR